MSALNTYVVYFQNKSEHVIGLTHKEEEVWPDGTHPMLFEESIW